MAPSESIETSPHLYLRQKEKVTGPKDSLYWKVHALQPDKLECYGFVVHREYHEGGDEISMVLSYGHGATASITTSKFTPYNEAMITSIIAQVRTKAKNSLEQLAEDLGLPLVEMSQEELDERGF